MPKSAYGIRRHCYVYTHICVSGVYVRDRESNKLSCDAWAIIKSETVTKKKSISP